MKKIRKTALVCAMALTLCVMTAGCGGSGQAAGRSDSGNKVESVLAEKTAEADAAEETAAGTEAVTETVEPETTAPETTVVATVLPGTAATAEPETIAPPAEGVDVDLTVMSSTVVYSEVYNMMMAPDEYVGKVVKMQGPCAIYHDENTDINYYACIIQDATACCSQGLEFVLNDSYVEPDDYPEAGEEITVVGTFETYYEGQYLYCTLIESEME